MYVIALYGLSIIGVSVLMIVKPERWVELATRYCEFRYMHPIEIAIAVGFGLPFLFYADQSPFPTLFRVFGVMLVAVGAGLMLTPPSLHRRFGIWSLQKMGRWFRPAGLVSLAFGAFLVYVAT